MDFFLNKKYQTEMDSGKIRHPGGEVQAENMAVFALDMAKYIYGAYCSNRTTFMCGGSNVRNRPMSELRAYARGVQNPDKYDEILDPVDADGKQHMNISRDIVQIMPKFRDRIKGKFEEVKFDFQVNAVDPIARKEREISMAKRKLSLRPELKQLIAMTGVKPTDQPDNTGLESDKDVDLLFALGGDRLFYESLMHAGISSTEYESNWDEELKDRLIDDLIDLYAFGFWTYTEKATGKIKVKYIDPEKAIIQKTVHNNHDGATYGGVIENYQIAQLRIEADLSEEQLISIARKYKEFPTNKGFGSVSTNSFRDYQAKSSQHEQWDQMTTQVMDFFFIAGEAEKFVYGRHHRDGNLIFDKVESESELSNRDITRGKTFVENAIQYVYTGKWIVGTDHVFNVEREYGTVRKGQPGFKTAIAPMHMYASDLPSIVERCIAFLDEIQLATLKKRNSLAKMPPGPRMVLDISKLHDSIDIGGEKHSTLDLVRAFSKEGVLIIKSKGEFDYLGQGASNGNPITYMPTGLLEDIQIFLNEVQSNISNIKMVTGIEDAIDMTQSQDLLVGVMKGVEAQTNTSLRPLFKSYKIMNLEARKYWMLKWQVMLANEDIDVTYMPIGAVSIQSVKLLKQLTYYEFGLQVEVMPSDEEKMMLMQFLMQQRNDRLIDIHHVFAIEQMIRSGRLKLAQLYIAKAVQEKEALVRQAQMEQIKANGEANSQPILVEMESKAKLMQQEYGLKEKLAQVEAQWEDWKAQKQFEREQMMVGAQQGSQLGMQAAQQQAMN